MKSFENDLLSCTKWMLQYANNDYLFRVLLNGCLHFRNNTHIEVLSHDLKPGGAPDAIGRACKNGGCKLLRGRT